MRQQEDECTVMCMWYGAKCAVVFMNVSESFSEDEGSDYLEERTHILGAAYEAICGRKRAKEDNTGVDGNEYIHVPSALKLRAAGITIRGHSGPLCSTSYENRCLSLPRMCMYDQTTSFIRNMAFYEEYFVENGCMFHDYVLFITDLIRSPEDLELLVQVDVISNSCGKRAFPMWEALNEGLDELPSSAKHHEMKRKIKRRCDRRRHVLWSEFKALFCDKPWLVMSTIAITLVTVATLIQTYTAITGSDRMKPRYGP